MHLLLHALHELMHALHELMHQLMHHPMHRDGVLGFMLPPNEQRGWSSLDPSTTRMNSPWAHRMV